MADHRNFSREEHGVGDKASAELEQGLGQSPSGVQGKSRGSSPWSGGQGRSLLKLKALKHMYA